MKGVGGIADDVVGDGALPVARQDGDGTARVALDVAHRVAGDGHVVVGIVGIADIDATQEDVLDHCAGDRDVIQAHARVGQDAVAGPDVRRVVGGIRVLAVDGQVLDGDAAVLEQEDVARPCAHRAAAHPPGFGPSSAGRTMVLAVPAPSMVRSLVTTTFSTYVPSSTWTTSPSIPICTPAGRVESLESMRPPSWRASSNV